jgi:hypothetical protein
MEKHVIDNFSVEIFVIELYDADLDKSAALIGGILNLN